MTIFKAQPYSIEIDTGVDLTTATELRIMYRRPNTAVNAYLPALIVSGTTGTLRADITSAVNDTAGEWKFFAWVTWGDPNLPAVSGNGITPGTPFSVNVVEV